MERRRLSRIVREKRLIMVGGKGGVGKTTCAASLALMCADMGYNTLVISSDPTPSLSDVFGVKIGDKITKLSNSLFLKAIELSERKILELWKRRYGDEVYEVLSSFLPVGRDIIDYIVGAPGLDEEFMLAYILDLVKSNEFDKIVWDTAPAGQTLRLLKLQLNLYNHLSDAAKLYVRIKRYLEKLREISGTKHRRSPLEIIDGWRALASEVMQMLRDGERTGFLLVTIPEALGVFQVRRISEELERIGVGIDKVIVNYVVPKSVRLNRYLASRYEVQRRYIGDLLQDYYDKIILVPLLPREVRGERELRRFYHILSAEVRNPEIVDVDVNTVV